MSGRSAVFGAASSYCRLCENTERKKAEVHFDEDFAFPTLGSLVIAFSQELSPTHASLRCATAIMITTSNFPAKRRGLRPINDSCWTAHHGLFRGRPRANRTFSLPRNPTPCATSNTDQPPSAAPPWRFSGPGVTRFDRYGAATVDSSRLHIDSPGDPSDSTPSVAGSGAGTVDAVFDSSTLASSGPFVLPAMIARLGMVS